MNAENRHPAGDDGSPDNSVTTTDNDTPEVSKSLTPEETARALDIARNLVKAGVPVFVAPPADNPLGFKLPPKWETSTPTLDVVNRWKPGWALAAVCGHGLDVLDVDPRNGGDTGAAGLKAAGMWPDSYGQAATPSGGTHDLIAPLRVGKGVPADGVDLQGGREDGTGRGFVFIAPTVRVSKVDGVARPYRWTVEPDVDRLTESATTDDTGAALAARISRGAVVAAPAAGVEPGSDPFATVSTLRGERREFTQEAAQAFVLEHGLAKLMDAKPGTIQNRANTAAAVLSHFVPEFWSAEQAYGILCNALARTAYDGKTWRAERFRSILDGTEQVRDPWKATRRAGAVDTIGQEGQAARKASMRERMRARLYDRDRIDSITPPTPLIDGVLDVATIAFLSGKFGTYKTFVSVAWACSIATGKPWEGREIVTPGPVLYVAAEGCSGLRARVRSWEVGNLDGRRIAPDRLAVYDGRVKITDPEEREILGEFIQEVRPVLVVLDTLHKCAPGMEENSSKDMGTVLDAVADLRERYGVTVLLNHHTGHNGERSRGSSSLEDDADTSWVVRLADQEDRSASNQRTLVHRKAKDRELLEETPLALELVEETGSAYVRAGTVPSANYLPDGLAAAGLIKMLDELGVPQSAGRDVCRKALGTRVKASTDLWAEALRRRKARESGQGEQA